MRTQKRGSVTVFSALTLMLVASLIFALLEAARQTEGQRLARRTAESSVASAFAGYDRAMWEEYHLLARMADYASGITFAGMEEELRAVAGDMLSAPDASGALNRTNLFTGEVSDACVEGYQLLTDGNGTVFGQAVAAYQKSVLPFTLAEKCKEQLDQLASLSEADPDQAVANAQDQMKKAKESGTADNADTAAASAPKKSVKDHPLKFYLKLRKMGMLALLLEPGTKQSKILTVCFR